MKNKFDNIIEKLFCKHKWKVIEDRAIKGAKVYLYGGKSDVIWRTIIQKCEICGKLKITKFTIP